MNHGRNCWKCRKRMWSGWRRIYRNLSGAEVCVCMVCYGHIVRENAQYPHRIAPTVYVPLPQGADD